MVQNNGHNPRINASDRLILALDVPFSDAQKLMEQVGGDISIIKINFMSFVALLSEPESKKFLNSLTEGGKELFLDFKFNDISNTVETYVKAISKLDYVKFCTIHGNSELMKAAAAGKNGSSSLNILIVTLLTSLDRYDLKDIMGVDSEIDVKDWVKKRVENALKYGCDGVIASGQEAEMIKDISGDKLLIVTPGIRRGFESTDDHKRAASPTAAILAGSDYLVVGRPIYNAEDPAAETKIIIKEMQDAFDKREQSH